MTDQKLAYWVDLEGIRFEDGRPDAAWLQAFPVGEYTHPLYGKIKMTVERARNMASNVIRKVRGIDIAIDYGHNSGGEAAGWVTSAEARQDGLWLFVEWTKAAAQAIRNGEYRYFSPEYVGTWKHPQTQEEFTDVVLGGGLTNRPFLKNIMPVNLSEIEGQTDPQVGQHEGGGMEKFLERLRAALKLSEDADEDAVFEALEKALQPDPEEIDPEPTETLTEEEVAKILDEHPALAGVLEDNKRLSTDNRNLTGRVVNLELTARGANVKVKLDEWHRGGEAQKHGLPPALDEEVTTFMLSLDETAQASFTKILDEIVKTGMVTFKETLVRRNLGGSPSDDVTKLVGDGIKALMDENEGMSYADASSLYFVENEEMYDKYITSLPEHEEEDQGVES